MLMLHSDLLNVPLHICDVCFTRDGRMHPLQALKSWHSLFGHYAREPLQPHVVCSIVEDMALALPYLAQGEPVWSPFDDPPEVEPDNGSPPALTQATRHITAYCFALYALSHEEPQLSIKEGLKIIVPSASSLKFSRSTPAFGPLTQEL